MFKWLVSWKDRFDDECVTTDGERMDRAAHGGTMIIVRCSTVTEYEYND